MNKFIKYMYCISIDDKILHKILDLNYIPVGLGDAKFSSDWITDNISLSEFAGVEQLYLQFKLSSDGYVVEDGIYIDNIKVFGYGSSSIMLGDINGDGLVNVIDIVNVVNIILDESSIIQDNLIADLNNDFDINVLDIVVLVGIILQN